MALREARDQRAPASRVSHASTGRPAQACERCAAPSVVARDGADRPRRPGAQNSRKRRAEVARAARASAARSDPRASGCWACARSRGSRSWAARRAGALRRAREPRRGRRARRCPAARGCETYPRRGGARSGPIVGHRQGPRRECVPPGGTNAAMWRGAQPAREAHLARLVAGSGDDHVVVAFARAARSTWRDAPDPVPRPRRAVAGAWPSCRRARRRRRDGPRAPARCSC